MPEPDHKSTKPVFYDESRRRWSWVLRLGAAGLMLSAFALACFVFSVLALPLLPRTALPKAAAERDTGNADPILKERRQRRRDFAFRIEKGKLAQLERERAVERQRSRAERKATEPALGPVGVPGSKQPIVAGFYVNWEETSKASLRRNIDHITHFFPEWLHLKPHLAHDMAYAQRRYGKVDFTPFSDGRIPEDKADIDPFVRARGVPIVPVINNYVPASDGSGDGEWDTDAIHDVVGDSRTRAFFIERLTAFVLRENWQGINIDFEQVAPEDRDNLVAFMRDLSRSFHGAGLMVTQDVAIDDDAFDLARLGEWNDALLPMLYDQHSPGDEAGAGSIAGIDWTRRQLERLFAQVPADKVVLAFGNYAYDWKDGQRDAATLNYQSAVVQAKESLDADDLAMGRVQLDPKSLNPYYRYLDDDGARHTVWMLDAASAYDQWMAARAYHPRGLAVWYMGSEDPDIWSVLGRDVLADPAQAVSAGALRTITYGRQSQVDFEGEGELLDVVAEPSDGVRSISVDPRTGLIAAERYESYPSSYVVRRYGYRPKSVALTFDDGPDPTYTPRVLDILREKGVKATFFVIGQQAESNPGLIARMWDQGEEIGNHTYTHPNMSLTGRERTLLEISATQRIIEAITGHSSILFRPPYAIDVEPRTGEELKPILLASRYGFISVGEKNDPQDWNLWKKAPDGEPVRRTARDIIDSAWDNRNVGNVILLHDGGGNRDATLQALPAIIDRFKAAGYRFITLSDLSGRTRAQLFPPVTGEEKVLVGVDKWVFESGFVVQTVLVTLFALSVALGISRQVLMAGLALLQRRREAHRIAALPAGYRPFVSVVIAAYNEEKVIESTVRTILASDYAPLEVVVVDDGSKDDTFEVVTVAFAGEPRVTCIRKPNGGKASALNRGLEAARGEIIVALDADTLFTPETVGRLARHFADPAVGAVSGNVRVGNTDNVLTRWQSLEYITSQNFDRRAYDLMNCITVVPGAIGAWRKSAIEQAGGYSSDTLAEDTDLTWRIRQAGWSICNDSTALAYTEAPDTVRNLSRQRYRWAFGTLQNLYKHRDAMFRNGAFGWVALPSLWLYQILFPAISPVMDVTVVWALFAGNFAHIGAYYGLMLGVELLGAALALWMDRGDWRLLPWLLLQRFMYRQLMYYVILKSLVSAVRGGAVGWNKLERKGTARVDEAAGAASAEAPPTAKR